MPIRAKFIFQSRPIVCRIYLITMFSAVVLLNALAAAPQTVEILYPGEGELLQPGETCSLVLRPLLGHYSKTNTIEYFWGDPGKEPRTVHTASLSDRGHLQYTYAPLQDEGIYTLGIRVTHKDGGSFEDAVNVRVESGQYDYWPAYHYPSFSELEAFKADPWLPYDHTKPGWDWSLPGHVVPAANSAIAFQRTFYQSQRFKQQSFQFPVNPIGSLWVRWKELEPVEGQFDFTVLEEIIRDAHSKGIRIALRIKFSRRGQRQGTDPDGNPLYNAFNSFAPEWMADKGIKLIEHPNGRVDYDPLDPTFHAYYLRFIKALGETEIPDLLAYAYVGYASQSHGDEGIGPHVGPGEDPAELYPVVKERLNAWAEAFEGQRHKIYMGGASQYGFELGFGIRSGFVEKYLYKIPDHILGTSIDPRGYLQIDETKPLHTLPLFNGDENEEYGEKWAQAKNGNRFGYSTATFPYRYFVSSLRLLQMRNNFVLTGSGHLIEGMLPFIALELGRTVEDAPDVWSYLNTSYLTKQYYQNNEQQVPPRPFSQAERESGLIECRNFERWLYQRDEPGFETEPRIKVNQPHAMWMTPAHKPYDYIARGGARIGFHIDDRWLERHGVGTLAIKISFIDSEMVNEQAADGTLVLRYFSNGKAVTTPVKLTGGDALRTATFFVEGLDANALSHGYDFVIEAGGGASEVVVSMARVIRADAPQSVVKK